MGSSGERPQNLSKNSIHNKLRSSNENRVYPGSENEWAIQEGINLGHLSRTDVLEILLKQVDESYLNDKAIAAILLVVALRDVLAESLGIEPRKLNCDVEQKRLDSGINTYSIFIFDKYASGYTSHADHLLNEIFHIAYKKLKCPNKCRSNCPKCILDFFDKRFSEKNLDRQETLKFLA